MDMKINHLPAPTWNFLRMNYAEVSGTAIETGTSSEAAVDCPDEIGREIVDLADILDEPKTGLGEDMVTAVSEVCETAERFWAEEKVVKPLRIKCCYDSLPAADVFALEVKDEAEMTVIMDFSSETASGEAGLLTHYHVGKHAKLTLVQVQRLGDDFRFFNDIGGSCDESGTFSLIQLVLGGRETYMGSYTALPAKRAALTTDIAYLLKGDEKLDMNYVADHTGRKTTCDIRVSGVLRDASEKLFRGTIDFHRGCAGAVGSELEEVLLMDENVRNRTIPLILCDEEDVEGNHGATIGRVDESVLFYLRSRGIPEAEIYEMMARAKVDTVLSKISDEAVVESVREFLDGTGNAVPE